MAQINVMSFQNLELPEAQKRVEKLMGEVQKKVASFGSQIKWTWKSDDVLTLEATTGLAKGMKGEVKVQSDRVEVGIDLPFFLKGFKDQVQQQVEAALKTAFV